VTDRKVLGELLTSEDRWWIRVNSVWDVRWGIASSGVPGSKKGLIVLDVIIARLGDSSG
jgi:hypothetical protein